MNDTRRFDVTVKIEETVRQLLNVDFRTDEQLPYVVWIGYVCERVDPTTVTVRKFTAHVRTDGGEIITSDAVKNAIRNAITEVAGE